MNLKATVKVPGTCGELVQGTVKGVHFHVTCPIDIYSEAVVEMDGASAHYRFPPGRTKSLAAVKKTLDFLGHEGASASLEIHSPLPLAKGMASSTADVAASIEATALALGKEISKSDIARVALSIEPTDGCFFPGIALFDHREGKLYESLGNPPPLDILVLDFGGEVDTMAFNRIDRSFLLRSLEPRFKEALAMARQGLKTGDTRLIGEAATLSSRTHQVVLFKPHLEAVIALAKETGAVGVNIAHSGTVIGVLLEKGKQEPEEIASFIRKHIPELQSIIPCSLISGGSIIPFSSKTR